ncbi:MAG: lamin tail domain-containing protein [Minisyncoccia bacterium]
MSRKLILVFIVIIFLSNANRVFADVVINEFVSDPDSGSEWVELFNTSEAEVVLNNWKWTELISPGAEAEHESSFKNLSGTISPGGFFVFEISSALNNGGDSIGLYNGEELEDRVTFGAVNNYSKDLDATAKGKSGALIGGSWKTGQNPTKGTANSASAESSDDEENEGNETGSGNNDENTNGGSSSSKAPPKLQKPKVQIITIPVAHAGIPFILEGTGTGETGEKLHRGRYYWNFGDGDSRETKVTSTEKFSHTYFYTGDYQVVLEYYPDIFADVPDAVDEVNIKVIDPQVTISAVGDTNDFFIEIANETSHNADISGWVIASNYRLFTLSRNTILASKKKIRISPKVSGFSTEDKNTLKLMTPERELVYDFNSSVVAKRAVKKSNSSQSKISESKAPALLSLNQGQSEEIGLGAQPALAIGSEIAGGDQTPSSWIMFVLGFVLVGMSALLVYFVRQKTEISGIGSDFEILDE